MREKTQSFTQINMIAPSTLNTGCHKAVVSPGCHFNKASVIHAIHAIEENIRIDSGATDFSFLHEEQAIYSKPLPCFIHFVLRHLKEKISPHFDLNLLRLQHYQSHRPFQLPPNSSAHPHICMLELPLDSPEHYSHVIELTDTEAGPGFNKTTPAYFKMKMLYYLHAFEVSFKLKDNGRLQFHKIECVSDNLFSFFYLNKRGQFQKKLKQEILAIEQTYNELCDKIQKSNLELFGVS